MKHVLLLRHASCEAPGYLDEFLQKRGIPFEIDCIGDGEPVPQSLSSISGLVLLGGPGNVNDDISWLHGEQALVRTAVEQNVPVMGICLGAQIISKALGGTVSDDYRLEVGWHQVEPFVSARGHRWLQDLDRKFEVFEWHAHEFDLPDGATPLLTSECTRYQAFTTGRILAMQFHLEVTAESVRNLSDLYASDLLHPSSCVQKTEEMCSDLEERISKLHQVADVIYSRWLEWL